MTTIYIYIYVYIKCQMWKMYKYPMQVSNVQVSNAKYFKSQLSKYKCPMKDMSNHNFFKFCENSGKDNHRLD
jgi:hypothetical protein